MFELYIIDLLMGFVISYPFVLFSFIVIVGITFLSESDKKYHCRIFKEKLDFDEIKKLKKIRIIFCVLIAIINVLFFLTPSYDTLDILKKNKLHELNLIKKNIYKE